MKPWKQLVIFHFVPICCTLVCVVLWLFFLPQNQNQVIQSPSNVPNYIHNLKDNPWYENEFLARKDDKEEIFILGSSELTGGTEATPYNFICDHFKTKMTGVGHAGNQCFSIYSQLLANEKRLKNAHVVIVLSPGWFYGSSAKGTSSSLLLEYNSSAYLKKIYEYYWADKNSNYSEEGFGIYAAERFSDYFGEFVNPELTVKLMHLECEADKSLMHKAIYGPVVRLDDAIRRFNTELNMPSHDVPIPKWGPIESENVKINWDSLFKVSREEHLKSSTNNPWHINNDYYDEYVKGKTSAIHLIPEEHNQELEDFRMLVKLLKAYECDASFIMMPLNPFFYSNLKDLDPLVKNIEDELKQNSFPCLNMWCSDSATIDNALLTDVMHLSKYGWYKADKFIVETYHLSK